MMGARNKKIYYHSRHIPERHLKLDTPLGEKVKHNGLCDVTEEPYASMLQDYKIDVIETRCVWWEIEPEPGVFDFSKIKADVKRLKELGFGIGIFPWFMHPPKWEKEMVRAKCIEHGEESSIPSLWDPRLLEHYDRLYAALAKELGDEIEFLYVCIYGDFGEPQYPHSTKHYKFSSPHAHYGLWAGDRLARADFSRVLKEKYGSIEALNAAWGTAHKDFDEDMMVWLDNINFLQDFQKWYTDSLMSFTDKAAETARKHFPKTRAGMPIGASSDRLDLGQTKSTDVKICAKYGLLSRCTNMADFPEFAYSNIISRRLATAAQFYGCDFGVEAALVQPADRALQTIYQEISSGTVLIHDDPGNIYRAKDVFFENRNIPGGLPFYCKLAAYYSVESEKCSYPSANGYHSDNRESIYAEKTFFELKASYPEKQFDELAKLRLCTDYDIVDYQLINDGFLNNCPALLLPRGVEIEKAVADRISDYTQSGGKVYYIESDPPIFLESGKPFICGEAIEDYTFFGGESRVFVTDHGDRISIYDEENQTIEFREK